MRGADEQTSDMFSYVSPEQRVPAGSSAAGDPPDDRRRASRRCRRGSRRLYSDIGRPSIPPEQLLRALLLQALYTIRSERLLMEQLDYNLLFRWFVGLEHGRPDLVADDVHEESRPAARRRHRRGVLRGGARARRASAGLLSDEHFTVDGTLLEAWASQKSFQPQGDGPTPPPDDPGNPTVNFHGETRKNDTHQSTTDPDARLYQKGAGQAKPSSAISGHVLIENRHGLVVERLCTAATGTANARRRCVMLTPSAPARDDRRRRQGLRHARASSPTCARWAITPHVAQKDAGSAHRRPHDAARRATRSVNGNGSWSSKSSAG